MADQVSTANEQPPIIAVDSVIKVTEIPQIAAVMADITTSTAATPIATGTGTGTVTPALSDVPLDEAQRNLSLNVSLADLSAKATALYAHKNYEEASEVYASAVEMQAEMNGEMSPENAEILFLYGRSLFKLGQSKSDVLGGKAPETKNKAQKPTKKKTKKANGVPAAAKDGEAGFSSSTSALPDADKVVEAAVKTVEEEAEEAKKPLFQFEGDEGYEDSDEEEVEEDEGEGEGEEAEEDDLALSFEILDMARVLFLKKLEQKEAAAAEGKGKEIAEGDDATVRHIKERLADTHGILTEISLENERFPEAVVDQREALRYKKQLYSEDSEIIAEAHYMLSLALEFASITQNVEGDKQQQEAEPQLIDQDLRDEAASELEAAINCQKLKLQNKEVELATLHSPEDNEETRKAITEVKEIIGEMEDKLVELRREPFDVKAALGLGSDSLPGVLGAAPGESTAETEARVEEAKKAATDLTGLVRKKKKEEPKPIAGEEQTNGKRKAEDEATEAGESKKARVEDEAMA